MTEFNAPAFYRHSGKFSPGLFLAGLVAASLAAAAIGAAYGFVGLYTHALGSGKLLFLASLLLWMGMGFGTGALSAWIFKRCHLRNTPLAVFASGIVAFAGIYSSWIFWIVALATYHHENISPLELANPARLWEIINRLNESGVWSISKDGEVKGVFLALIWIVEAGGILIMAGMFTRKQMNKTVYCETCHAWGTSRQLARLNPGDMIAIRQSLEAGDVAALAALGPSSLGNASWVSVDLEGCPTCDNLQTLTVDLKTLKQEKNGKSKIVTTSVIRRRILSSENILQLAEVAASASNPPASPPGFPVEPPQS